MPEVGRCQRCDYISSQPVCKACLMLEGLNRRVLLRMKHIEAAPAADDAALSWSAAAGRDLAWQR